MGREAGGSRRGDAGKGRGRVKKSRVELVVQERGILANGIGCHKGNKIRTRWSWCDDQPWIKGLCPMR